MYNKETHYDLKENVPFLAALLLSLVIDYLCAVCIAGVDTGNKMAGGFFNIANL